MEVPAETKISLKALVEKESNKVIFVEADNDFIDVLFSFLTIPMGRIVRFARDHSEPLEIGCMNKLYQTIEKLDEQLFRSNVHRHMLLHPRTLADYRCKNLKLKLIDNNEPIKTEDFNCFTCSSPFQCISPFSGFSAPRYREYRVKLLSYCKDVPCPNCLSRMDSKCLPWDGSQTGGIFVREKSRAMITDDLQVIPPLSVASFSLFTKLGEMNSNSYEERTFCIGAKEILNLLVSSLVSKTPFTETLLENYHVPKFRIENFGPGKSGESQMLGASKNEEKENISVKLIVSKAKNLVCYAEVREDFVNLLFSFMTLPLGFILKVILDFPWKGCTDRLWKGVLDFDEEFLESNCKEELLCDSRRLDGWFEYKAYRSHGFSKGPAIFTVTDNLDVRLVSPIFQLSILNDLKVPLTDIESRTVSVGNKEALNLLASSFLSDSVLTNAFLRNPKGPAV